MIKQAHGLKSYQISQNGDILSNKYLESDICLGMYEETPILEKIFLEYFKETAQRIFVYSNFSQEDFIKQDYNPLSDAIVNFNQENSYGIVISLNAEIIETKKVKLLAILKKFIFDCRAHKAQTIAIKVFYEDGVQTVFKLPKYLSFSDLDTAMDTLQKDLTKLLSVENNCGKTMLFDLKTGSFRLE